MSEADAVSRLRELREFAQAWLGRELTAADAMEAPTSLALPAALREIYQTCGAVWRSLATMREMSGSMGKGWAKRAEGGTWDGYKLSKMRWEVTTGL